MYRRKSVNNTGNSPVAVGKRMSLAVFLVHLCFVLSAGAADFTIQPYLQAPGTTEMTIQWEMDALAEGTVTFRTDAGDPAVVTVTEPVETPKGYESPPYLYAAKLTGLTPDAAYTYTVKSGDGIAGGSFTTFSEKADTFTFIAYGDSRSNPVGHKKVVSNFRRHNPRFILHSGDFVGDGRNRPSWKTDFFEPLEGVINHIPLFAAYGNHEKDGVMLNFYLTPKGRLYYSFDYGNAHFNFLRSSGSETELAWQDADLTASKATWKFAVYHVPSFNIGGKGGRWGRATVVPMLRKHKVDVTFTGDSHIYERFHPLVPLKDPTAHPITHIVSGGGGAPKYHTEDHPCVAGHKSMSHFLVVKVKPESITIDVRQIDDTLFESFTINKKNGVYDAAYRAAVLPEEAVIISQRLSSGRDGLRFQSNGLPGPDKAVDVTCVYPGDDVVYPVTGVITLSEKSKENFVMEPEELPFSVVNTNETKASFRVRSTARPSVTRGGQIAPPLSMVYRCKVGQVDLNIEKAVSLDGELLKGWKKNANPVYGWNKDGTFDASRPRELGWVPVGTPAPHERQWRYTSFSVAPDKLYRELKPDEEGDSRAFEDAVPENLKGWYKPEFDDSAWQQGRAPIGKGKWKMGRDKFLENQSAWGDGNILLMRTTFDVKDLNLLAFRLAALNKESYHLYLNGHRIRSYVWYYGRTDYRIKEMTDEVSKHLKKGTNVLAVYTMTDKNGVNSVDMFFDGLTKEGQARLDELMNENFSPE